MIIDRYVKQFNWRFLLVRIVVNAIVLAVTAAIVPKIYFVDTSIWNWLFMALMLGVLNALLKPVLQVLTLQFLFVTYGLVLVIVNALILLLLSFLFPNRFAVDNLWWALVGGLVLGLVSSFLESLLGLTMPIVSDEPPELRQQLEEQARHLSWPIVEDEPAPAEEREQAAELPAQEALAPGVKQGPDGAELEQLPTGAAATGSGPPDDAASVDSAPISEGEQAPGEVERTSVSSPASTPPAGVGADPAADPQEEAKEDRS